jgi:hypothetical protein
MLFRSVLSYAYSIKCFLIKLEREQSKERYVNTIKIFSNKKIPSRFFDD